MNHLRPLTLLITFNSSLPQCLIYASMNLVIIGSDSGLSPVQRQAITWTNAALLSIGLLRTNFSEIWTGMLSFSFKKIHLKMTSAKMMVILSGGNELKQHNIFRNFISPFDLPNASQGLKDHSAYKLNQWEMTLNCYNASHWLSSYQESPWTAYWKSCCSIGNLFTESMLPFLKTLLVK